MDTKPNNPKILKDGKIDTKIKLSALWVALMFCYTYADILGLIVWFAWKWPKTEA